MTQIVIRSPALGAYLDQSGAWSRFLAEAKCFETAADAGEYCRRKELRNVEILVVRAGRPPMSIPVGQNVQRSPNSQRPSAPK
jgi:hypothetical protein